MECLTKASDGVQSDLTSEKERALAYDERGTKEVLAKTHQLVCWDLLLLLPNGRAPISPGPWKNPPEQRAIR